MKREFCFYYKDIHCIIIKNAMDLGLKVWVGNKIPIISFPPLLESSTVSKKEYKGPLTQEDALQVKDREFLFGFSDPNMIDDDNFFIHYFLHYLTVTPDGHMYFWPKNQILLEEQKKIENTFNKFRNRLKRKCLFHNRSRCWVVKDRILEWNRLWTKLQIHQRDLITSNSKYGKQFLKTRQE